MSDNSKLVITLQDGRTLQWRKAGFTEGYALMSDVGGCIRFLDEFESDFVESTVRAAALLGSRANDCEAMRQLERAQEQSMLAEESISKLASLAFVTKGFCDRVAAHFEFGEATYLYHEARMHSFAIEQVLEHVKKGEQQ